MQTQPRSDKSTLMSLSLSEQFADIRPSLERLANQSANCKIWSVALFSTILLFALGKAGGDNLLWAAAPLTLFAFVDASYVARARALVAFVNRNNSNSTGELIQFQVTDGGFAMALKSLASLSSFSVLPFYLCLIGLAFGLGSTVLNNKSKSIPLQPSLSLPSLASPTPSPYYSSNFPQSPRPTQGGPAIRPASPFPVPNSQGPHLPPTFQSSTPPPQPPNPSQLGLSRPNLPQNPPPSAAPNATQVNGPSPATSGANPPAARQ